MLVVLGGGFLRNFPPRIFVFSTMNAAVAHDNLADGDTNLYADVAFSDIKWDEATQWNNIYCPVATENFRAGESVEIDPPIEIGGARNFRSHVGTILQVNQQSNPQRVLLSLFINITPDMGVPPQDSPRDRDYLQYPSKQVAWTRYQGWYPVTRVLREAFLVTPWEVNAGLNSAQVAYGMTNAYCVTARWNHDVARRAFQPLGHDENVIPGCLHMVDFDSATQRYWSFRTTVALKIADVFSKCALGTTAKQSIHLENITPSHWNNLKKRTIALEDTQRKGIVTTKTIRKHLTVEKLRNATIKQFARFDTERRCSFDRGENDKLFWDSIGGSLGGGGWS